MCRFTVLVLLSASLLVSCGKQESARPAPIEASAQVEQPAASPAEFKSLTGKWARTDGDYVLEIREVAPDGKMQAGYFNPGSINVSKALAIKESSGTKVFVELQDTGYPGCTYSLTFDPATTQLHGQYFQAAMQQTYDVVFAKLQE